LERSYDEQANGIESGQDNLTSRLETVMEMEKGPINFGLLKEDFMSAPSSSRDTPAASSSGINANADAPSLAAAGFALSSDGAIISSSVPRAVAKTRPFSASRARQWLNKPSGKNKKDEERTRRNNPVASEAEWQHRIWKRERAVEGVKKSALYLAYRQNRPLEERTEDDPKTPDAKDRSLPKRKWEYEIQQWRKKIRTWLHGEEEEDADREEGGDDEMED
jgi:hypothetical protein